LVPLPPAAIKTDDKAAMFNSLIDKLKSLDLAREVDDDIQSARTAPSGSATPMIQPGEGKQLTERQQRRRKKRRLLLRLREAEAAVAKQAAKTMDTGGAPAPIVTEVGSDVGNAPIVTEVGSDVGNEAETGQDELESAPGPLSPGNQRLRPSDMQAGDVVILGSGAPPEFRRSSAVVTKVAETHCTVIVLDESGRFGRGECWPCFADMELDPDRGPWHLGNRVMIEGLTSSRTKHLNGFSGIIAAHPREGHPTFVRKPADPDRPQLTLCIRLDDPAAAGEKGSVLLEPRFLTAHDKFLRQVSGDLSATLAFLNGSPPEDAATISALGA